MNELTDEEEKLARAIFELAAPVLPVLLNQLGKLDSEIGGGFLLCFRGDGSIATITGNMPPSVTIPMLARAMELLAGNDAQLVETAFADTKAKAN